MYQCSLLHNHTITYLKIFHYSFYYFLPLMTSYAVLLAPSFLSHKHNHCQWKYLYYTCCTNRIQETTPSHRIEFPLDMLEVEGIWLFLVQSVTAGYMYEAVCLIQAPQRFMTQMILSHRFWSLTWTLQNTDFHKSTPIGGNGSCHHIFIIKGPEINFLQQSN